MWKNFCEQYTYIYIIRITLAFLFKNAYYISLSIYKIIYESNKDFLKTIKRVYNNAILYYNNNMTFYKFINDTIFKKSKISNTYFFIHNKHTIYNKIFLSIIPYIYRVVVVFVTIVSLYIYIQNTTEHSYV